MVNHEVDDLFNGIENFFNAIREKCSDDEEYATEILKARGFLLEDTRLVLSDNSHKDDSVYLNELLTEEKLGEVKENEIFIRPNANVEKIFYSKNISGCEAFSPGESWKKFIHNSFASKVQLRLLEPFVGRYIKAISACGVSTCGSCDGNHSSRRNVQRILIDFTDNPNRFWHEIICKRLLDKRFKLKWNSEYSAISFNKVNKWQTYTELNRAAEFLYNNRIKLREIRREASNRITCSMAKHLSSEELAKNFSEKADKLLDDFFK